MKNSKPALDEEAPRLGPAERDLDNIWYYIAKNSGSIDIANRIVDSITEHFALFVQTPAASMRRSETEQGLRCFPVGNYIIYYRESCSRKPDQRRAYLEDPD